MYHGDMGVRYLMKMRRGEITNDLGVWHLINLPHMLGEAYLVGNPQIGSCL